MNATTVIPRYFQQNRNLQCFTPHRAYGVEFRYSLDVLRYTMITTSHVLVFILKGEKTIHLESGDINVNSGNLVFIPKGSYIFSDVKGINNELTRLVLFFEDEFLQDFLKLTKTSTQLPVNPCPIIKLEMNSLLQKSIDSLKPYLNGSLTYGEQLITMKLHEILFNILENDTESRFLAALHHSCTSPKKELKNFMEKNFMQPLTVQEFAKLSYRSPRQFTRDFDSLFQQSPALWLRNKRLNYAHQLLMNSTLTLSEICFESGFKNYSNFIQLFRTKFNITPKKLLAQN